MIAQQIVIVVQEYKCYFNDHGQPHEDSQQLLAWIEDWAVEAGENVGDNVRSFVFI